MNYMFGVFAPPIITTGRICIQLIINNDNFLNMSNDKKFVFLLNFKLKYVCIYLEKAWEEKQKYYINERVILLT